MYCKKCDFDVNPTTIPRPDTPHAGEARCPDCYSFLGWIKKEKNEGKREKQKDSPESLGIDNCQICRLIRKDLPDHETLDIHHLDGDPKNEDRLNKIVSCTSCHKLVHYQITYRNHFIEKQFRLYEQFKKRLASINLKSKEYEIIIKEYTDFLGF